MASKRAMASGYTDARRRGPPPQGASAGELPRSRCACCSSRVCVVIVAVAAACLRLTALHPPALPWECYIAGSGCPHFAVHGYVAPGYEAVEALFRQGFDDGFEVGAAVTAFVRGSRVVSLSGGWLDQPGGAEFTNASRTVVFSCTKVLESLAIAMAADRGQLDLDAPIAQYWPEFGTHGKDEIKVSDLMRHRAGMPVLNEPVGRDMLLPENHAALAKVLASQVPMWLPRSDPTQAYHAMTRGMFANELLRRVDPQGRSMRRFVNEEVVAPLKTALAGAGADANAAADAIAFDIGFDTRDQMTDVAVMHEPPPWYKALVLLPQAVLPSVEWLAPESPLVQWAWPGLRTLSLEDRRLVWKMLDRGSVSSRSLNGIIANTSFAISKVGSSWEFMKTELSSASGVTNSLTMASIAAVLASGGETSLDLSHDGKDGHKSSPVHLLTAAGLAAAVETDGPRYESFAGRNFSYTAVGWGSDRFGPGIIGWGGAGGSVMVFDEANGIGFSYVPTMAAPRLTKPRAMRLLAEVTRAARLSARGD